MADNLKWGFNPDAARVKRIERISKHRDPTTYADEILMWTNRLMYTSLLFTGALCFFSYEKFLSNTMPSGGAVIGAILITIVIEVLKKKIGQYAVRMPFLDGFRAVFSNVESTVVWLGVTAATLLVFTMSAYNSTKGAERYALISARQKTETGFTPNTSSYDDQIKSAQDRVASHQKNKWKGIVIIESQKAITAETRSIKSLTEAKEQAIAQQRADFERQRGFTDESNGQNSQAILAIGGFLELLQIIFLLIQGACERILDKKIRNSAATNSNGSSFQNMGAARLVTFNQPQNSEPRRPIGFQQNNPPQPPQSVPQVSTAVPQTNAVFDSDAVLKLSRGGLIRNRGLHKDPHANNNSISKRLKDNIEDVLAIIGHEKFKPTPKVFQEWVTVVDEVFADWMNIEQKYLTPEYYQVIYYSICQYEQHA